MFSVLRFLDSKQMKHDVLAHAKLHISKQRCNSLPVLSDPASQMCRDVIGCF